MAANAITPAAFGHAPLRRGASAGVPLPRRRGDRDAPGAFGGSGPGDGPEISGPLARRRGGREPRRSGGVPSASAALFAALFRVVSHVST
ncbi:hypothetical protein [Microbispora catharanthi]|uniref:Uncharacterized protein n=1 Tax=Microbispora catharanthi TaxID=1712871 RepID=A0A5N6BVG0_9ACTN|nr:hypothetical protein [Microbispora catharanthi]KAB8184437.1 hypothetical protein FH610_015070 [Microbispora catharanthi]